MGKLFAVVLAIITVVSTAIFVTHTWWLPVDISAHGHAIDHQLAETMLSSGGPVRPPPAGPGPLFLRVGAPPAPRREEHPPREQPARPPLGYGESQHLLQAQAKIH